MNENVKLLNTLNGINFKEDSRKTLKWESEKSKFEFR